MFTQRTLLICALLLSFCASHPTHAHADSETDLRESVASLNHWLGADQDSRRWRQILNLNVLDSQAALGHRADIETLRGILHAFNTTTSDLNHPVFNRVKNSIDAHLEQMQFNQLGVDYEATRLVNEYKNFQIDDFENLRREAIYKIKMLKRYYKQTILSRERALLFYEFRPDATVAFLEGMQFELAPERSPVTIRDEIQTLQQQIKMIDEEIEELNAQREKIEQWIDKVESPENVTPPMPDDDDDNELKLDHQNGQTETNFGVIAPKKQQEIEELENGRMALLEQKQHLQDQIESLQGEIKRLEATEKDRIDRLRKTLPMFRKILAKWNDVSLRRNDSYFVQSHNVLQSILTSYLAAANPNTAKQVADRLERLLELHGRIAADPNDRLAAAELGLISGWLEDAGQAENLVASLRRRYSQSNIYLNIDSQLIDKFASRDVSETKKLNEQVLSRLIRGVAQVDGTVSVQTTPDPHQIRASIDFTGTIDSDTFTRAGKLTAYAGAIGQFNVRRDLFVNVGGMFACDVYGDVQLESFFNCIDSSSQLVQKIALKQYHKTKALAESISRENTKSQLLPQFESQTDEALDAGFTQFETLSDRQAEVGKWLPAIYMHTTNYGIAVVGHKATKYDLAATHPPQQFPSIPADVRLTLNESAISNYLSPMVAGKKFSNKELVAKFQELLVGSASEEQPEDVEEITIRFDDARPIQIEFENNLLAVTISGKEFTRAGKRIRDGLRIRVAFKVVRDDLGLSLQPTGDVKVELMDPDRKNIATVSFKKFLQDRLSEVLSSAEGASVPLPENLIPAELIESPAKEFAAAMQLVQFRLDAGWLYLGWKHSANDLYSSYVSDTPAIGYPMPAPAIDANTPGEDELDISGQLEEYDTSSE